MADETIKVRNGVKVFTRMADNAGAIATGIVDVMNKFKDKHPVLQERIPVVEEVMASSSNNFIYGKDVFFDNKTPKQATRVLEIYITWVDIPESYIVHLSANIGSNAVSFAAGFETLNKVLDWMPAFTEAMNDVLCKVIDDMDALIDEEERKVREMAYTNIIKTEVDKKIRGYDKELRTIKWENGKETIVESALVQIGKLSDDFVSIYPILDFTLEVGDNEGVPLFNILVRIKDSNRKDPVGNTDIFVKFYDGDEYTDYFRARSGYEEDFALTKTVLSEVMLPIAEGIFPDLAILQRAIIDKTVEKISEVQSKS